MVLSKPALATVRPSGLQATFITQPVCPESVWHTYPLATSHTLTVLSQLPLTSCAPSGLQASPTTKWVCPLSVCTQVAGCVPCSAHTRMHLSKPPPASCVPSGLQATQFTVPPWTVIVCTFTPDLASQSRMVASSPQLAIICRLKARALSTVSVCACQARCKACPSWRHTSTSPRELPAAQNVPLGLMATDQMALKVLVKTVSRSVASTSDASCISTPCRCTPRRARRDRSQPRRFPRSTRSSAIRLAGP